MFIQNLIHQRIFKSDFKIFNRQGELQSCEKIRNEYQSIRSYLLHNLTDENILAIKATKDYKYLLTVLASLDLGLTFIPMMQNYPDHRVEQIKSDSNFKLLVTDELLTEITGNPRVNNIQPKIISPNHTAYIIFTSGSTGKPKGVMIPRKAIENFTQWVGEEFFYIGPEDSLLQVTEFTFDIVFTDVALFLQRNVPVYFSNFNSDLFRLAFEIENYKIKTLSTVPNNLSMLLSDVMKGSLWTNREHCLFSW